MTFSIAASSVLPVNPVDFILLPISPDKDAFVVQAVVDLLEGLLLFFRFCLLENDIMNSVC